MKKTNVMPIYDCLSTDFIYFHFLVQKREIISSSFSYKRNNCDSIKSQYALMTQQTNYNIQDVYQIDLQLLETDFMI